MALSAQLTSIPDLQKRGGRRGMSSTLVPGRIFAAFMLAVTALGATRPAGASPHRTVIIVDASQGSSRPFDRTNWLEAQRRALDAVLPGGDDRARADILRLGGPTDTSCDTAPLAARRELAALEPTGARGLAAAITDAVNRLLSTPAGRQIIVLTSGGDGCQRDVCREADEWRNQVGLGAVHLVAPQGARVPGCLGAPTFVSDVTALTATLNAILSRSERPASVVVESTADGRYREALVEAYPVGDAKPCATGRSLKAVAVMPGQYDIRAVAREGGVEREGWTRGVVVSAERQPVRVALGPGPARLVVRIRVNGQPTVQAARISVHPAGRRDEEAAGGWPDEELQLPPGTYDVTATLPGDLLGEHQIWREKVSLVGGQRTEVTLDGARKVGTLNVCPVAGGARLVEAVVLLLADGARGSSQTRLTPCSDERLPAGRYTVAIERMTAVGAITSHHDGIEVNADGRTAASMELQRLSRLVIEWTGALRGDWIVGIVRPGRGKPSEWFALDVPMEVPPGEWDLRFERGDAWPRRGFWMRGVVLGEGETKRLRVAPPEGGKQR